MQVRTGRWSARYPSGYDAELNAAKNRRRLTPPTHFSVMTSILDGPVVNFSLNPVIPRFIKIQIVTGLSKRLHEKNGTMISIKKIFTLATPPLDPARNFSAIPCPPGPDSYAGEDRLLLDNYPTVGRLSHTLRPCGKISGRPAPQSLLISSGNTRSRHGGRQRVRPECSLLSLR